MSPSVQEVVASDGHRFDVRRFAASAGAAARRPLLFVPALGVPAHKYDPFASALAAAGVDVAVPGWRGLGSSTWRAARGCDWGYRELFRDLDAVLSALGPLPQAFGGHSLGGQFAAMVAARHPSACAGLVLIASGVPAPATFDRVRGSALAVLARAMPLLVGAVGHFPGTHLKFAGREAAGVMRDWAATARTGRYADYGDGPLETRLASVVAPAHAIGFADDWMAPPASTSRLLDKLGAGPRRVDVLDEAALGTRADHFRWLRRPDAVVAALLEGPTLSS